MHKEKKLPELKPLLKERLKLLMPDENDFKKFLETIKQPPQNSIRCNIIKISPEKLKERLESKKWIVEQPFSQHKEIMIIKGKYVNNGDNESNNKNIISDEKSAGSVKDNKFNYKNYGSNINNLNINKRTSGASEPNIVDLEPGELGRSLEHLLGYYYVQEIASMLPVLALKPKPHETILDLAAAPGSKTTQIASEMNNTGLIIANDVSIGRISILATNLERCGVANCVITRKQGFELCKKLKEQVFLFDKILLDAPCSGEGTLRSSPATAKMWNIRSIKNLSNIQKSLLASAIEILKPEGEIVYSTCTHAPEENEEVIDFALNKFKGKIIIESINLPIKCRGGLAHWDGKTYINDVKKSCRIYPQDNDTEGFFICKIKKIK